MISEEYGPDEDGFCLLPRRPEEIQKTLDLLNKILKQSNHSIFYQNNIETNITRLESELEESQEFYATQGSRDTGNSSLD